MNVQELLTELGLHQGQTSARTCYKCDDFWPCPPAQAAERLAKVADLHDPTNERFCPQCGWDTEPMGLPHPDLCPTIRALNGMEP